MAISRMQEPRQMYGLGSLVKKAVRGVKKIVKSPLGKAALIGAGIYGLGAIGPGGFSKARLLSRIGLGGIGGNTAREAAIMRNAGVKTGFLSNLFGNMTTGQKIFAGLGTAAVATPFLQSAFGMGPYEEVEEEQVTDYIDPYTAYIMSRNRDPSLAFLPRPEAAQAGYYLPPQMAAEGGRIGYANGEMVQPSGVQLPPEAEQFLRQEYVKYKQQGGDLSYEEFKMMVLQAASGEQGPEQEEIMTTEAEVVETPEEGIMQMAKGGRIPAQEGGLMNLGGLEKDYRTGGFVEIGKKEKADDVPARLSVNEFVFTADAVRNAGDGDIDKGAEVMDKMMKHLEAGGKVSEESQGLEGAQEMYEQSKILETRIA